MQYQIMTGDNRHTLTTLADNSVDAIVTDPPYGIDFLGKAWDANTGALETYQECLRVLKPGGHILAFSAARTYHHLAITLEQAGFEIRDQIMWIYSSGFPKSQDIGRSIQRSNKNEEPNEWNGWGTQLKPAHEPIALARKPIKLSIAKNCQQWGVGALNIDATRIEGLTEKELNWTPQRQQAGDNTEIGTFGASGLIGQEISMFNDKGRFPSNVIGEIPDYQKYFYCPKVGRRERHIEGQVENNHPTVKPIELMKYLIKLVTPEGGTVLDPFNGSGSTGCAAVELGMTYIGCELDPAYVDIARSRIEAWYALTHPLQSTGLFE
jgi:site-specific DNA-methyltransferase (adenine-specific)